MNLICFPAYVKMCFLLWRSLGWENVLFELGSEKVKSPRLTPTPGLMSGALTIPPRCNSVLFFVNSGHVPVSSSDHLGQHRQSH